MFCKRFTGGLRVDKLKGTPEDTAGGEVRKSHIPRPKNNSKKHSRNSETRGKNYEDHYEDSKIFAFSHVPGIRRDSERFNAGISMETTPAYTESLMTSPGSPSIPAVRALHPITSSLSAVVGILLKPYTRRSGGSMTNLQPLRKFTK